VVIEKLLPSFCEPRGFDPRGFKSRVVKLSDRDCSDFLRAWEGGLLTDLGDGKYRTGLSGANEQFFWEGLKSVQPRPITLWLEPVITVAAMARLYFDHDWPLDRLGLQSKDYAFDVVAYEPSGDRECIAGEVKKSVKEVNQLVELMQHFGAEPTAPLPDSGKERNAFKKIVALRDRQPSVFWAVGPDRHEFIYLLEYDGPIIQFVNADSHALNNR
jgi:hypothetical protein